MKKTSKKTTPKPATRRSPTRKVDRARPAGTREGTPKKTAVGLAEYRAKRDFDVTPEPPPTEKAEHSDGLPTFMVHKHHATRMHYDLRLEMDGALASWSVPKGPSFDPAVKRMAVQTEDHPLAYGQFEGRIPDGEYGAGDSLIWDRGTYRAVESGGEGEARPDASRDRLEIASRQRKKGRLHLEFFGEKLRGRFHLVRTRMGEGGSNSGCCGRRMMGRRRRGSTWWRRGRSRW